MNFTTLMNKNYEELVFNLIFPRKPHFQVQVDSEILLLGHVGILFGLVLHMMVWAVLMMVQIANEWLGLYICLVK